MAFTKVGGFPECGKWQKNTWGRFPERGKWQKMYLMIILIAGNRIKRLKKAHM